MPSGTKFYRSVAHFPHYSLAGIRYKPSRNLKLNHKLSDRIILRACSPKISQMNSAVYIVVSIRLMNLKYPWSFCLAKHSALERTPISPETTHDRVLLSKGEGFSYRLSSRRMEFCHLGDTLET